MSEDVLRGRLEAFEATRTFFIQMWIENPTLLAQAGARIQALLKPLETSPDHASAREP